MHLKSFVSEWFDLFLTHSLFIHSVGAQMTWTMQQWLIAYKQRGTTGLWHLDKWSQMLFMLPPDRLRKHLELHLKVELFFINTPVCFSVVDGGTFTLNHHHRAKRWHSCSCFWFLSASLPPVCHTFACLIFPSESRGIYLVIDKRRSNRNSDDCLVCLTVRINWRSATVQIHPELSFLL